MTKSLNNNYVTGTPKSYLGGGTPVILMDILIDPDTSTYLYFASKNITIQGRAYTAKIKNIAEIKAALGSGLDSISFTLENTEYADGTRVSTYIDTYGLFRKRIEVYQFFEDDTDTLATRDLLFTGVVAPESKGISYDKEQIKFDVEDLSTSYHKLIGKTYEEMGYVTAPDSIKTKMLPIVYGKQKSLKLHPVTSKVEATVRFPLTATDDEIELNEDSDFDAWPRSESSSAFYYVSIGGEVIKYDKVEDNKLKVYKEDIGSISSVDNTVADNIITGSATTWQSKLQVGDLIKLDADDNKKWHRVKSIESDTKITIEGAWKTATGLPANAQKHGRGQAYFNTDFQSTFIDKTLPENHEAGANATLLQTTKFIGAAGTNRSVSNTFLEDTISNLQTTGTEGILRPLPTEFVNNAGAFLLPGRDLDKPADPILLSKWNKTSNLTVEGFDPEFIVSDFCATGDDGSGVPTAYFVVGGIDKFKNYQVYMLAPKLGENKWKRIWDSRVTVSGFTYQAISATAFSINTLGGICNFDKDGKVCWLLGAASGVKRLYIYDYTTNTFSSKDCNLDAGSNAFPDGLVIAQLDSPFDADDSAIEAHATACHITQAPSSSYPVVWSLKSLNAANPLLFSLSGAEANGICQEIRAASRTAKSIGDWLIEGNSTDHSGIAEIAYSGANIQYKTYRQDALPSGAISAVTVAKAQAQANLDTITALYNPYRRYGSFDDWSGTFAAAVGYANEIPYRSYVAKYSTTELYGQNHIMVGNYKYSLRSTTTDDYATLGAAVDFKRAYASCVFAVRGNDEKVYVGLVADTSLDKVNVDVYSLTSDTRVVGSGTYATGTGYINDPDAKFNVDLSDGDVVEVIDWESDLTATFSITATKTITQADIIDGTNVDMSGLGLSDATRYLYRIKTGNEKTSKLVSQITLNKSATVHDLYCRTFIIDNDIYILPYADTEYNTNNVQRIPMVQESLQTSEYNVGVVFSHWPTLPKESANYYATSQPMESGEDDSYNTLNTTTQEWKKTTANQVLDFTDSNGILMYHTPNVVLASDRTDGRASRTTVRVDEVGHREGEFRLRTNKGTRVREAYIRINYFAPKSAAMAGDSLRLSVSGQTFDVPATSSPFTVTNQAYVELPLLDDSVPAAFSDQAPITFRQKIEGITQISDLVSKDITLTWNGSSATTDILINEIVWDLSVFEDVEEDVDNIYADITLATGDFHHSSDTQGASTYDNYVDGMNPLRAIHDIIEDGYDGQVLYSASLDADTRQGDKFLKLHDGTYLMTATELDTNWYSAVHKSDNDGRTWIRKNQFQPNGSVSDAVTRGLAQNTDGAVYALTGDSIPGNTWLNESTDLGETWTAISKPSDMLAAMYLTTTSNGRIWITGSTDSVGNVGDPSVWYRTLTNSSWTKVIVDAAFTAEVDALVEDSTGNLYCKTIDTTDADNRVFRSTDDGATWTEVYVVNQDDGGTHLFITSEDDVIVTKQDATNTNVVAAISRDDGATWIEYDIALVSATASVPAIIELDKNTLLAGGKPALYLSTDKGLTWTNLALDTEITIANDLIAISKEAILFTGGNATSSVNNAVTAFAVPFDYGTLKRQYTDLIDEASFDAASIKLKANNIKMNGAISTRENSKDLLEDICFQFRLHHWWDESGKLHVVYKDDLADYGSVVRTLDANFMLDLKGPKIAVPNNLFSKFKVHYDRIRVDGTGGEFSFEVDRDVSALRTFGLIERNEEVLAKYINDANTAKKLVRQIEEYNTTEYKMFTMQMTMNEMAMERMDIIALTNTFETIAKGYVVEVRRTFGKNRYNIIARKIS